MTPSGAGPPRGHRPSNAEAASVLRVCGRRPRQPVAYPCRAGPRHWLRGDGRLTTSMTESTFPVDDHGRRARGEDEVLAPPRSGGGRRGDPHFEGRKADRSSGSHGRNVTGARPRNREETNRDWRGLRCTAARRCRFRFITTTRSGLPIPRCIIVIQPGCPTSEKVLRPNAEDTPWRSLHPTSRPSF
jgi:hypothetical protein